MSTVRIVFFCLATLALLAGQPRAATFVGDLVYCDVDANGVFDGVDYELNGVGVGIRCLSGEEVCFESSTTTGGLHPSAVIQLQNFPAACSESTTWDPTNPAEHSGRYLFEITGSPNAPGCFNGLEVPFELPWVCTITVDESTLPVSCDGIVTPRDGGFPDDTNADGDLCDPGDGPFPEGQPIGNLPSQGGCQAYPDPLPTTGQYTTVTDAIAPLGDRCSLHNDFGYTEVPVFEGPTRTPGFWKNHPGATEQLLPITFCGELITDECRATEIMSTGGGGLNQFSRHAVAGLLNCAAYGCPTEIADLIAAGSAACGAMDMSFDYGSAGTLLDLYNESQAEEGDNPPGFNVDKERCK